MRNSGLALLLALAGCHQQAMAPAEPKPAVFEGGQRNDAAALVAHGERLTRVLGCRSCHGEDLQGGRFYADDPAMGRVFTANITRKVAGHSTGQVERILREGRGIDGRDLWIMPSDTFQRLSAPDMAALVTYLRTLRPAGREYPPPEFGPKARQQMKSGDLEPESVWVPQARAQLPVDLGERYRLGRYYASVTCAECHGFNLAGWPGNTPDLIVAGTYSRDEFERLLTRGQARAGRKIKPIMRFVARERFAHFTRQERDAVYAYLHARAERPQ